MLTISADILSCIGIFLKEKKILGIKSVRILLSLRARDLWHLGISKKRVVGEKSMCLWALSLSWNLLILALFKPAPFPYYIVSLLKWELRLVCLWTINTHHNNDNRQCLLHCRSCAECYTWVSLFNVHDHPGYCFHSSLTEGEAEPQKGKLIASRLYG